jgi:hypothetical protein
MMGVLDWTCCLAPLQVLSQLDAWPLVLDWWAGWKLEFNPGFALAGIDFADAGDVLWALCGRIAY